MVYNLTNVINGTGITGFISGVNNELTFGWLGIMILIIIVAVAFTSFLTTTGDVRKAFAGSGFISIGISILLKALGLIPDKAMFICLVIGALIVAFSFIGDN